MIYLCQVSIQALRNYIHTLYPVSDTTWEKMRVLFGEVYLRKGDLFIGDGEMATHIGFLDSGIMRAFYRTDNGTEYNKHFFVPYCFIGGYSSLVTGRPNQIIQEALSDCHIYSAPFEQLTALYDSCPDFERATRRLAELFFAQKEQREIDIVLLDAEQRYIILQKQFPKLEQQIPQYHIASYLGVTPTQLSRIRKKRAHTS